MATGYEDIDKLTAQQNSLLDDQQKRQQEIIKQQTQMNVDELERTKQEINRDTTKTNRGLYTDYQKEVNQYGARAEQLASQGLLNTGYAETTKLGLYNTYQKNVTETLTNSQNLKADVDFKISQARQNGSLQEAQAAVDLYTQKLQLLTQQYEMRENRKQFLYQQQRDKVSDQQWQKSFDEQVRQSEIENQWKQKNFDYQKQRDAVADSQWQQQFNLSKKKSNSGNRSGNLDVNPDDDVKDDKKTYSKEEVLRNIEPMKGVNKDGTAETRVVDGLTGKIYKDVVALLKAYDM